MSEHTVTHATFTLERVYDAAPERVFAAMSQPEAKLRWFANSEGWTTDEYSLDFRVGGREVYRGRPEGGPAITYDSEIQDIVPNERIVNSYQMTVDGTRISVSLATVQIAPEGSGARLTLTEQGAFLDGFDDPGLREKGTADLLDALGAELKRAAGS